MLPTSVSLIDRLKRATPDDPDWERLERLYRPLILGWLGRVPGLGVEAEDLAQEVVVVLLREIGRFDRRRNGSFRTWLRGVTVNRVRDWRRGRQRHPSVSIDPAEGFLDRLAEPAGELAREWDHEHDRHVIQRLLDAVSRDFSQVTWESFRRCAIDGLPASQIAEELGTSVNAVIQSKSRVLRRLREEAGDLLE